MRTIRSAIITLVALGMIAGMGAVVSAQDADVRAPAAVLGWALDETHFADGESGEVGDMWVREGVAYSYRWDADDPRLSGDAIWTGTGHRYATEPMFEVQSASWEVTNDRGGWSGTSTAIIGNGLGDTDTVVLTGSGDYDGLTAYLLMTWSRSGANIRGAIFPGPMPLAPVPAAGE